MTTGKKPATWPDEFGLDLEAKKQLSSSLQGNLATRHDLAGIRWSQDSEVRAAMAEAEASLNGLRASTDSTLLRATYPTRAPLLEAHGDEGDVDPSEDGSAGEVSAEDSPRVPPPPAVAFRAARGVSFTSPGGVSSYGEDDFEADDLPRSEGSDGSGEEGDGHDDEDEEEDDDEGSSSPRSPPPSMEARALAPTRSADAAPSLAALPQLVAKLCRLGSSDFERWGDDGVVERGDFVQLMSEYRTTFDEPLRLRAIAAAMAGYGGGGRLADDALYGALFDALAAGEESAPVAALQRFFLVDTAHVHAVGAEHPAAATAATSVAPHPVAAARVVLPTATAALSADEGDDYRNTDDEEEDEDDAPFARAAEEMAAETSEDDAGDYGGDDSKGTSYGESFEHSTQPFPATGTGTTTAGPAADGDTAAARPQPSGIGPVTRTAMPPALGAAPASVSAVGPPTSLATTADATAVAGPAPMAPPTTKTMDAKAATAGSWSGAAPTHAPAMEALMAWFMATQGNAQASTTLPLPMPPPPQPRPASREVPLELRPFLEPAAGSASEGSPRRALASLTVGDVGDLLWGVGLGAGGVAAALAGHGVDGGLLALVEAAGDLEDVGMAVAVRRRRLLAIVDTLRSSGVPERLLDHGRALRRRGQATESEGTGVGYRAGERYDHGRGSSKPSPQPKPSPSPPPAGDATAAAEAVGAAVLSSATYGAADPLWGGPPSRPHELAGDPTLPMARVYLRLLAESQQEAAEWKRRCGDLTRENERLRGTALPGAQTAAEGAAGGSAGLAPEIGGSGSLGDAERPVTSAADAPPAPSATNHPTLPTQGLGAGFGLFETSRGGGGGLWKENACFGGGGLAFHGHGAAPACGDDLLLQHTARSAALRRQYDQLRSHLSATRASADFIGRYASVQPYTRLADVERELSAARRPALSIEDALRRVDAGLSLPF